MPQRRIAFDGDHLVIDLDRQRVVRDGRDVHVSPTEFRLLAYLAVNAGRVIPRHELISQVWGADSGRLGPYPTIYLRRLRQKIAADAAHLAYSSPARSQAVRPLATPCRPSRYGRPPDMIEGRAQGEAP